MRQVVVRAFARHSGHGLAGLAVRQSLPMMAVLALAWLMRDQLAALDLTEIKAAVKNVEPYQWYLAACATCLSFWAIGRYDEIVHGLLETRVPNDEARLGGLTAVAISQFAGFGALTASLVRWRMLKDVSLFSALRISAAVTGSFLIGWAVFTSLLSLAVPGQTFVPPLIAALTLAIGGALFVAPSLTSKLPRYFPTSLAMAKIVLLVALDVGCAAVALYILLPSGTDIQLTAFIVAFSIALVAGLVSGTPGGIGAFELCLLSQLPTLDQEPLVAAALAFRLVYHLLPALLAIALLLRGPAPASKIRPLPITNPRVPNLPPRLEMALWNAPFAEAKLLRHGEFGIMGDAEKPKALVAQLGQSLTMLTGSLETKQDGSFLNDFRALAQSQSRFPVIYKASPKLANAAVLSGWKSLPISQEALINPADFSLEGSKKRQLRRMVRKAEQNGLTVRQVGQSMPRQSMEKIAKDWALNNKSERGFSMGTFDLDCIRYQRIFVAEMNREIVGFITLHECKAQWTLDLMRCHSDAPNGTMHLLVVTAIEAAKSAGVASFSLAASQLENTQNNPLSRWLYCQIQVRSNSQGLRRFKTSFDPTWSDRFILAPSWLSLGLGLIDITLKIHQKRHVHVGSNHERIS